MGFLSVMLPMMCILVWTHLVSVKYVGRMLEKPIQHSMVARNRDLGSGLKGSQHGPGVLLNGVNTSLGLAV